jgi:hypothetical protein
MDVVVEDHHIHPELRSLLRVGLAPGSVKAYAVVSCDVDYVDDHGCTLSEYSFSLETIYYAEPAQSSIQARRIGVSQYFCKLYCTGMVRVGIYHRPRRC